jgi:hypothetical protein
MGIVEEWRSIATRDGSKLRACSNPVNLSCSKSARDAWQAGDSRHADLVELMLRKLAEGLANSKID